MTKRDMITPIALYQALLFLAALLSAQVGGCGSEFDKCEAHECCQEELEECSEECDGWWSESEGEEWSGGTGGDRSGCLNECNDDYSECAERVSSIPK